MDTATCGAKLTAQYDAEQDILYFLFTDKAREALAEEVDDEVFVRYDPETRKVISLEFLDFHERIRTIFGPDIKYFGTEKPEKLLLSLQK